MAVPWLAKYRLKSCITSEGNLLSSLWLQNAAIAGESITRMWHAKHASAFIISTLISVQQDVTVAPSISLPCSSTCRMLSRQTLCQHACRRMPMTANTTGILLHLHALCHMLCSVVCGRLLQERPDRKVHLQTKLQLHVRSLDWWYVQCATWVKMLFGQSRIISTMTFGFQVCSAMVCR